jgi:1,4-alpha-glucan branching enzyme
MPASLPPAADHIPMGANLVAGGATFRCWSPHSSVKNIWVCGDFNGWVADDTSLLNRRGAHWVGFLPGVSDGDTYKFYVEGELGPEFKRDPYARELTKTPAYPKCDCIVRDATAYPWRDEDFVPPRLNDLILYQMHVGTFNGPDRETRPAKFLDVLGKLDYLVALGINAIQLLPIVEFASPRSRGYEGSDIFSPEMDYAMEASELGDYLSLVNGLRDRVGLQPLGLDVLASQCNQLKAMIELFHLRGIAVLFDIVYNHSGGQIKGQSESLWNFAQVFMHNDNDSSYHTSEDWTGPVWALWKEPVRQFLIDNAVSFVQEYHVDGFRYDEVSAIIVKNANDGWRFCQHITGTVRHTDPASLQAAEYWNPGPDPAVVRFSEHGGAGFDACWQDRLRDAIRDAVRSSAWGRQSFVDVRAIGQALWPSGFLNAWRSVQSIENHDEVYQDKGDKGRRIASLADPSNSRSWWARSRSRVAAGLLLTAPGIPMLFMGQEFLEDKHWSDDPSNHPGHLIWWDGLDYGKDPAMVNFHRYIEALIWLRRQQPALRSEHLAVFHDRNDTRVLGFQRWIEGEGRDVVIVANFNEATQYGYELDWPSAGPWREIFNSDAYDDYRAVGNAGCVEAWWGGQERLPARVRLTLPANSILVFSR